MVALVLAICFAATNGLHDASNAIATLVATRAATPRQAIVLATIFNLAGPFLIGAAVADTIGGIVEVSSGAAVEVIGAGLVAAVVWNLGTWLKGLPSSSAHALIGGLVGASLLEGGIHAVRWGGLDGAHPIGVLGAVVALALSPLLGALAALAMIRILRRLGARATRRWRSPLRGAQWTMSAALAFSHGANDAQKSVGVIAALMLAEGHTDTLNAPAWATLACAMALTAGTALGGWSIVRTVGRRIYRIGSPEGLASQTASAGVIFAASFAGAPASTTQVVTSSVVGVGGGRRRWHHIHWALVRQIGLAWLVTMPACGVVAAATLAAWRLVA